MDAALPRYCVGRSEKTWVVIDRTKRKISDNNDVVFRSPTRVAARLKAREMNEQTKAPAAEPGPSA